MTTKDGKIVIVLALNPKTGDAVRVNSREEAKAFEADGFRLMALVGEGS